MDDAYPLYGSVKLDNGIPLSAALARRNGGFGAVVDPTLLARLGIKPGARLTIGSAPIEIAAVLANEPDKLAGGIGFGPRVLISEAALDATGLTAARQPGAPALPRGRAGRQRPRRGRAGRRRRQATAERRLGGPQPQQRLPALERNVERFTQFLTLVGLTALLVGGVGVANAVKSHLDRKRDVIATLKSLGASGGRVFSIYLLQVLALSLIGALIGLALGAALPFVISASFGAIIPLPIAPALHFGELALASLYGLLTALAFAVWPLGRAHDVPVSALFRDAVSLERRWPRRRYVFAAAAVIAALAAFAVFAGL